MFSAHIFVAYSNDSIARSCQKLRTCTVIGLLSFSVMHTALELDDDTFASTVKVHDEAVEHVLSAKLQTEYAPIAQQRPRMTLGGSRPMAQRAGERETLRRSEVAKRTYDPRMPIGLRVEATRIPRVRSENMRANSPFVPPLPKGEGDRG